MTQTAAKTPLTTPALTVQSPDPVATVEDETTQEGQEGDESGATPLPPPVKDAAFAAQQERERLAEERRQKAYDMFERLKDKRFLPKNLTRRTTFKEGELYNKCRRYLTSKFSELVGVFKVFLFFLEAMILLFLSRQREQFN